MFAREKAAIISQKYYFHTPNITIWPAVFKGTYWIIYRNYMYNTYLHECNITYGTRLPTSGFRKVYLFLCNIRVVWQHWDDSQPSSSIPTLQEVPPWPVDQRPLQTWNISKQRLRPYHVHFSVTFIINCAKNTYGRHSYGLAKLKHKE